MSIAQMNRFVKRGGEDIVYTTFAIGARDAYEDVTYTADASPPTIKGIRTDGSNQVTRDETGEERSVDVTFLVSAVSKDSVGNVVTIEDDSGLRAATVRDVAGRIYKVVGVGHSGIPVGARRLFCAQQVP